ncbi:MAG TPA: tetratricopeptide repeat protein, partial [Gemmataceae bacterium]|nr:tetratricopeptide repeat protein [Gemmataceae bacterium]
TTTQRRSVEKVLRVADEKYKRLLESAPESEPAAEGRARVLNTLAGVYLDLGDLGRSRESAAEAVELYTKLAKRHPEAARFQAGLALGHERLGCVRGRRGDSKAALEEFRKALAIRQRLADDGVNDPDLQEGLARCQTRVGNVLLSWGDVSGAKAAFEEGFKIRERLARQEPRNGRRQRGLALAWGKLGAVRWQEGDRAGSAAAYHTTLDILQRLAKDDPGRADWLLLAEAHMEVGNALWEEKRTRPALEQYEAARQIAEPLARLDPENLECLRVSLYARLQARERAGGAADPAAGRRERLAEYQSFLDVVRRRAEKEPADTMLRGWMALHHRKIGLLLAQLGRKEEAVASLRKAVEIDEALTRQDPDDEGRMTGLNLSHFLLATVQGDGKKANETRLAGERAVAAFHQRRAGSDPKKAEWQRAYAAQLQRLGGQLYVMERHAEAAAELRKAVAVFERLPERPAWQNELAACHDTLANALAGQGDHKGEVAEHRKALAIRKRLAEKHPDDVTYQRGLVFTSQQLVSALRIQGDLKEAQAAFAASRPARARLLKVKLADLAAWGPPESPGFGVAAIRSLYAPGRASRAREYLAGREQLWGLTGRLDRTIDVTEAIVELVEALDLADPAGAAEARQLLIRARDIYRRLNDEGQLLKEEKELIADFDRAVKGLAAELKPAPAAPPARELATLRDHKVSVRGVGYLAGGKLLATLGGDGALILRDPATGAARTTFAVPADGLTCVDLTPDGASLAAGFRDGTVKIFDMATKKEKIAWKAHQGPVAYLVCSPDGRTLATARQADQKGIGEVKLWDAAGKESKALLGEVGLVNVLAFSPDGKLLAAGGGRLKGEAWLWDVAAGKQRQPLQGHDYNVTAVAFSPDGKRLATASQDDTIRLWDAATGRGLGVLSGHAGWVLAVAFSPDGKSLASGGLDGTVRLWDVKGKRQRGELRGRAGWVYGVAFAPDGKALAAVSGDPLVPAAPGELRLWRLAGE